jgi:CO/xanthine dehydrogenase FAD-binding subunit
MKPRGFEYMAPTTLQGALQALHDGGEEARLLAGGQTLVPIMNFRLATPDLLVDLNGVNELSGIALKPDGALKIGAMTRHRMVELSDVVRDAMPLLHAAMPLIAHVQIRNRGTIGGSLAHADPAAEWPALCLALDATITVTGLSGSRVISAAEFSLGMLTTALKPGDILTEVNFPAWKPGRRFGLQEMSRRTGDFALAGIACTIDVDDSGLVTASRIVVFGVEDQPMLLDVVSSAIRGRKLTDSLLRDVGDLAASVVSPRSDFHASEDYRRELVDVLLRRALAQAASTPSLRKAA